MIDEDAVAANMAAAFDIDVDKCDPDADPNDRPEMVEIAIDDAGRFYAVQVMTTAHGYGRVKTVPRYYFRPCENPADAQDGAVSLLGKHWETFDDDDDDY